MKILNLHLKILTAPLFNTIDEIVNEMIQIYATADITVNLSSTENLSLTNASILQLNDIDTDTCSLASPSVEQVTLSNFRSNAASTDIVAYFCHSVSTNGGILNGCATYPPSRPMVVIASYSSLYTLPHEVGHVLGLVHVNNTDQLMTGRGTGNITNPPPDLTQNEIAIMNNSPFVH